MFELPYDFIPFGLNARYKNKFFIYMLINYKIILSFRLIYSVVLLIRLLIMEILFKYKSIFILITG